MVGGCIRTSERLGATKSGGQVRITGREGIGDVRDKNEWLYDTT